MKPDRNASIRSQLARVKDTRQAGNYKPGFDPGRKTRD